MITKNMTRRILMATLLLLIVFMPSAFGSKLGKEPGSPVGSYPLSEFDNVSLFNGNLNFTLPFLAVSGRADSGTYMSLNIQRQWSNWHYIYQRTISLTPNPDILPVPMSSECQTYWDWLDTQWLYQMWCTGANHNSFSQVYVYDIVFHNPIPEPVINPVKPGYGPGILKGKTRLYATQGCKYWDPTTNGYLYNNFGQLPLSSKAYLTFTEPDGTEREFVDLATHGAVVGSPMSLCDGPLPPSQRGTIWVSTEDTATTFVADGPLPEAMGTVSNFAIESFYGPSGVLLKKDGTRYRIDGGLVSWIRDRNGNLTDFTYDSNRRVKTIKDSLGRVSSVNYDVDDTATSPDGTPYGLCDQITFNGAYETPRTIRITKRVLSQVLHSGTLQTTAELWPNLGSYGNAGAPFGDSIPYFVSRLWLPDGRSYKFSYNSFAELARVELPTGAAVEYDHDYTINNTITGQLRHFWDQGSVLLRRVTERREYTDKTDPNSLTTRTTFSNIYADGYFGQDVNPLPVVVDQRNKDGALLSRTKHYFAGHPMKSVQLLPAGMTCCSSIRVPPWDNNLEKQTEVIDIDDGQTVLRRVNNEWEPRIPAQDYKEAMDVNLIETKTTLTDTNLVTKKTFTYDSFNNVTDTREHDFGVGASSLYPIRHVHTDYLTTNNGVDYTDPNGAHLPSLPSLEQVYSVDPQTGAETLASQTETKYDETPLLPWYGTVPNWADPGTARGNQTTSRTWLNTTGAWLETRAQSDQVGNTTKSWDAMNNVTEVKYSADYFHAYATELTSPIPDPGGANGSSASMVTRTTYDFSTGGITSTEDTNGQITLFDYHDPLSRLKHVVPPPGGSEVTYEYGDTVGNLYLRRIAALDAGRTRESYTFFDGLGRETRSFNSEDGGWIGKETQYDGIGRVSQVTNPYRTDTLNSAPASPQWTSTIYDSLSRAIKLKTSDNVEIGTSYVGNSLTVTDQAGKKRKSVTDALGRLRKVYEDPEGANALNQLTSYEYDALDNLTSVVQGEQTRTFVYDSLKRLISAIHPEVCDQQGVPIPVVYQYDKNSNLVVKTDSRNVSIHYSYDALNRPVRRWYNGSNSLTAITNNTPNLPANVGASQEVNYFYDGKGVVAQVPNSMGRLTKVASAVSSMLYTEFDALGRPKSNSQVTDAQTYVMNYVYDLEGNITSESYPSGRVVATEYDGAGRIAGVKNAMGGNYYAGSAPTDATNRIQYAPHGPVRAMKLGNGLWEHTIFNSRLQPTEIGLATTSEGVDRLKLTYDFGTTLNNGNLLGQTIVVPTVAGIQGFTAIQTYSYDALNRLDSAKELNSSVQVWRQSYSYDRYGNRRIDTSTDQYGPRTTANIAPTAVDNPAISTANNRFIANQGYGYDNAGNLTASSGRSFEYDADNRQVSLDTNPQTQEKDATYTYDGMGRRVKRTLGAATTIFVYDIAGQLIAEYDSQPSTGSGASYITSDSLGTPRVITDSNGNVESRHDYLPYGEELNVGRNGSYGGDSLRQKFTSKERDNETGLDYFGARYYSSVQGRFTSADEGEPEGLEPQTWNRYQYARNNPLAFVDADGNKDEPAKSQRVNEALGKDPTLLEVIKASNNFSQRAFEDALNRGDLRGRLDSGSANTLRGLAGEAITMDQLHYKAKSLLVVSQPGSLSRFGFDVSLPDNIAPDIGVFFTNGSIRVYGVGRIEAQTTLHNVVSNANGTTTNVTLSDSVHFGLIEVKSGFTPRNISRGATQVATTAAFLTATKLPGIAILVVDKDAFGKLSPLERARIYRTVNAAGGYIQLHDGLAAEAAKRARDVARAAQ